MKKFKGTKGAWRIGKPAGTVVSDKKVSTQADTGHDDVDYYGGYLIVESIARKEDAKLIAAAPTMLHLHRLQNLIFDLTGKELEVKL